MEGYGRCAFLEVAKLLILERETGFEPATSSLGICHIFASTTLTRLWRAFSTLPSLAISVIGSSNLANRGTIKVHPFYDDCFAFTATDHSLLSRHSFTIPALWRDGRNSTLYVGVTTFRESQNHPCFHRDRISLPRDMAHNTMRRIDRGKLRAEPYGLNGAYPG